MGKCLDELNQAWKKMANQKAPCRFILRFGGKELQKKCCLA